VPNSFVFVYGSLKRGYYGHAQMDGCRFVAGTRTADPAYTMVAFPWPDAPHEAYPGLIEGESFIMGEVYEAPEAIMPRLDEFELEGRDYKCREILLENGMTAWAYLSINLEAQKVLYQHTRIGFDDSANEFTWLNKAD